MNFQTFGLVLGIWVILSPILLLPIALVTAHTDYEWIIFSYLGLLIIQIIIVGLAALFEDHTPGQGPPI